MPFLLEGEFLAKLNENDIANPQNGWLNLQEQKKKEKEGTTKSKQAPSSNNKKEKTTDSTPNGQYTVPNPNGYINGAGLPTSSQNALGSWNTGAITGDLKRSNVRQTGIRVPRTFSVPVVTFRTQMGEVNASYVLGRQDLNALIQAGYSQEMNNELLGFSTKNDNQADIPSMTLRLSAMRTWDEVLLPNDYASLKMVVWGDNYTQPETTVLMTGFISEVKPMADPSSNQVSYIVSCQGVAKIMSNVTLTTFSELAVYGGVLLQDTSGTDTIDTNATANSDDDNEVED